MLQKPQLVLHADWSVRPQKRWMVRAVLDNGRYHLHAPEKVGSLDDWFARLKRSINSDGSMLVGLDFSIGLPLAYAEQVGISNFVAWLPQAGHGTWQGFYEVARTEDEIGWKRPFYPQAPGGTRQQHLLDALEVTEMDQLRRQCELARPGRRAAAPLFWTMGAQQVGKATITGWRELIAPALQNPVLQVAIWPFAGELDVLLKLDQIVLAEVYPTEIYDWLGIAFLPQPGRKSGKRVQTDRQANVPALLAAADALNVNVLPACYRAIVDGFGAGADGEDPFDAMVGVLGMLWMVEGKRPLHEPTDNEIRKIEGWILGQGQS